jgi:IS30 family transposase
MPPQEYQSVWQGWHSGKSATEISRDLGKSLTSVYYHLKKHGGIEPAKRNRAKSHLSQSEREQISRGIAAGLSLRGIAQELNRSPSSISREVTRHGGRDAYRAVEADKAAWENARRPKKCVLLLRPALCDMVSDKLRELWSPQQISGWLRLEHPDDETMQVSHETIYKSLYIQSRGTLKQELQGLLRRRRKFRQSRLTNKGGNRGQISDAISISERPAEVEDRAVPGHWEGDLICGSGNSYIATLVERQTRFVLLVKVEGKETQQVVDALIRQMRQLPELVQKTLTWDRGSELADHERFSIATDIDVYFCDPKSPWQRGSNENTNGLLRQYFPKGTRLDGFSQNELNKVATQLNERPRKTLGYLTPLQCLLKVLH